MTLRRFCAILGAEPPCGGTPYAGGTPYSAFPFHTETAARLCDFQKGRISMTTVTLGRSGIVSPKNAFGALPIQRITKNEAVKLLQTAADAGFTYFDTARAYTDSEEKLGEAFFARGQQKREQLTIATKTAALTAEDFRRDLYESLRLLRTDYIDLYQFHNPAVCPKPGDGSGLYEAMLEAKEKGLIRHIGITNHRPRTAEEAVRSGLYETLQFPFCYLASDGDLALVRLCEEKNVGFIAMKGLSGGLLTCAAAAYAWMERFPKVLPIWGIQRERELSEFIALGRGEGRAARETLDALIEKDRKELSGDFCRACGYCMPCPAGIRISQCARMSQLIRRSPSAEYLTPEGQAMMAQIENCLSCGQCISKCPYGLNTPALLRKNLEDYRNILAGKTVC